jgi:hypothetical protein
VVHLAQLAALPARPRAQSLTRGPHLSSPLPRRLLSGLCRRRRRVRAVHAPFAWPACQDGPPGLFISVRRPLDVPTRAIAAALARTASHQNPKPSSPPPLLFPQRRRCLVTVSHPGAAQGGMEPPCAVCGRARAPWRPRNLAGASPETTTRVAALTGRPVASPLRSPSLLASSLRAHRLGATRAPNRGPEPWIGSRWPAPPLLTAGHRRIPPPAAAQRSRATCATRSRSDASDLTRCPAYPQATAVVRSRSNGSRSNQLVKPRRLCEFCRKPPMFSGIHRYTLSQRQNHYGSVLFSFILA